MSGTAFHFRSKKMMNFTPSMIATAKNVNSRVMMWSFRRENLRPGFRRFPMGRRVGLLPFAPSRLPSHNFLKVVLDQLCRKPNGVAFTSLVPFQIHISRPCNFARIIRASMIES